jgi:hypothetical protein
MSKLDAQRAMREAKYARDSASGPTRREAAAAASGTPASPASEPASGRASKSSKPASPARTKPSAAASTDLCGHRSMNGRSCTREAGHDEKSHRYG